MTPETQAPPATTARQRETSSDAMRTEHARAVRQMFGAIAGRYDLFNHLFSANVDARWRKTVARTLAEVLAKPDAMILDVACGTGDLSLALGQASARLTKDSSAPARIIATDFCRPMLSIAQTKAAATAFIEGDALRLPFASNSFDAATIAFGLRNLSSVTEGLTELHRILKPNGVLVILEFSKPVIPIFREGFNFYFKHILPRIGDAFNGSTGAYLYLSESVSKFPDQPQLAALMNEANLHNVTYRNLTGGIAAIHVGKK